MIARLKTYGAKAATVWFQWASFKLGFFIGGLCMAIYMAILFTIPGVAQSIMGALK